MFSVRLSQPLILLCLLTREVLCQVTATVAVAAPSAAPTIAPDLVSLSIELDRWTDWSGTTSRNAFTFNALNNLGQITGAPPRLRIGGDTEDRTDWSPTMKFSTATFDPPTANTPYPEGSNIILGDGFYQTAQFLPPNTRFTWGVNFKNGNMTDLYLQAKSLLKAFTSSAVTSAGIMLDYIEIGNEVGLGDPPRHVSSLQDYISRWTSYATNITGSFGIPSTTSHTKFWAGAFAGTMWTPQDLFASGGILESHAGSLVTAYSQHKYEGGFCSGAAGLLQNLMDKNLIRSNLTGLIDDAAATRAKGFEYYLGETNSDSCHGIPGVSNTAGAALWTLDHALHASQIGITRLYFHEGVGFKYNLIQPVTLTVSTTDGTPLQKPLPPHVQPQYYGAIIAAEAIGKGTTRAVELTIDNERISGYAFYSGNRLARIVLINSQAYLATTIGTRPSTLVKLAFTGSGAPTKMVVKRLAIAHADDTSGLTWGGQTYETANAKVSGTLKTTSANVADGVTISATEAVLLTF
ncbi:hypothetical protein GALMADRAFT_221653 [Galerina marginata CBS 339.88]|uniref:Beta-glucuronidase C-terminal domain-containing protein n=1 Tax=Galerina marginata (strain CBS 339.88) TaxID=685588 RepID=A0A067THF8_GALM3|nr:hypothetical protein GALMADRAFT_221653 [Galerina marginata CBS 339.88]